MDDKNQEILVKALKEALAGYQSKVEVLKEMLAYCQSEVDAAVRQPKADIIREILADSRRKYTDWLPVER
ncbi:MAG: hypothetical protein ACRCTL_01700 [Pseudomonas sp.]